MPVQIVSMPEYEHNVSRLKAWYGDSLINLYFQLVKQGTPQKDWPRFPSIEKNRIHMVLFFTQDRDTITPDDYQRLAKFIGGKVSGLISKVKLNPKFRFEFGREDSASRRLKDRFFMSGDISSGDKEVLNSLYPPNLANSLLLYGWKQLPELINLVAPTVRVGSSVLGNDEDTPTKLRMEERQDTIFTTRYILNLIRTSSWAEQNQVDLLPAILYRGKELAWQKEADSIEEAVHVLQRPYKIHEGFGV